MGWSKSTPAEEQYSRLALTFSRHSSKIDGMKITLQIQILPDAAQADRLKAIMERFNAAANWIVGELFAGKVTNKITAQELLYHQVRERFGLGAQTAILCIHRAVEAYKRDTSIPPVFRPNAAITPPSWCTPTRLDWYLVPKPPRRGPPAAESAAAAPTRA